MDSENSSSDTLPKKKWEKSCQRNEVRTARLEVPASDSVTFLSRGGHYLPAKQMKLKNSLLAGVGFLELANAGDFAANIWNEIPVPPYAAALMAVGGALALFMSYFALTDAILSWRNLRVLRGERHELRGQKRRCTEDTRTVRDLNTRLNVNLREIGMELINRASMDILMGFGAVVIGIGTLMAIGGANLRVWQASNLLSGYIGNVPLALYAVVNAAWCCYVWTKARQHGIAGAKVLDKDGAGFRLRHRVRNVQIYTVTYGVTGICGGVGSLLVSTRWWGYVILVPVIISSITCNYIWRRKIGYDRPCFQQMPRMDQVSLIQNLDFVVSVRHELQGASSTFPHRIVSDSHEIGSVIRFIAANDLFEDFSIRLLQDANLSVALFGNANQSVTISSQILLMADPVYIPRILEIAQKCVCEMGPIHFQYQERYLLDTLGHYLCTPEVRMTDKTMDVV